MTAEVRIGNHEDRRPFLDKRERTNRYLGQILSEITQNLTEEEDVSGHIQRRALGLSVASTSQFTELYASISNRIDRFEPTQIQGKVRGMLFAHLARHEISQSAASGILVVSEDETLLFLKKALKLKTTRDEDGREFADHKYAPDGMILDQTSDGPIVLAFTEYSSSPDFFKFQSQVHGFRRLRDELGLGISTDFVIVIPGIPEETRTRFWRDLVDRSGVGSDEKQHIKVVPASFTLSEFNRYSRYVLFNYIDPLTGRTLDQLGQDRRLPDVRFKKPVRNAELVRRVAAMFGHDRTEGRADAEYVANHGSRRERPLSKAAVLLDVRTQQRRRAPRLAKIA